MLPAAIRSRNISDRSGLSTGRCSAGERVQKNSGLVSDMVEIPMAVSLLGSKRV